MGQEYTVTGTPNAQFMLGKGASEAANIPYVDASGALRTVDAGDTFYEPVYRFLSDDGTTGGTKDANVDGSGTAAAFYCGPPPGEIWVVRQMIANIRDSGAFDSGGYGAISALPLTNGVLFHKAVKTAPATPTFDYLNGLPVKTTSHWTRHCYDGRLDNFGAGDAFYVAKWDLATSGTPAILDGDAGEVLAVVVRDDLSGLTGHTFQIQGYVAS